MKKFDDYNTRYSSKLRQIRIFSQKKILTNKKNRGYNPLFFITIRLLFHFTRTICPNGKSDLDHSFCDCYIFFQPATADN